MEMQTLTIPVTISTVHKTNRTSANPKPSKPILKTIVTVVATVLIVALCAAGTAILTYRATMENIQVQTHGNTVTLTVFGQSDEYSIEGGNENA